MSLTTPDRHAKTDAAVMSPIQRRWSTRAFDPTAEIDETTLTTLLEAARWAPSANNTQPWRFIVTRRGTEDHAKLAANLMGFNGEWAPNASMLIATLAEREDSEGNPRRFGEYDLGQSVAFLVLQAVDLGLTVRQMGGVDRDGVRAAFDVPDRFEVMTAVAIGRSGDAESVLSADLLQRESLPRERKGVAEMLHEV